MELQLPLFTRHSLVSVTMQGGDNIFTCLCGNKRLLIGIVVRGNGDSLFKLLLGNLKSFLGQLTGGGGGGS